MIIQYLVIINIFSFIMCILDKYYAINNKYRISEKLFLLISIIGGAFGLVFGMHLVRHKTKKNKFNIPIYIIFIIWILVVGMVLW
ncbi:MAG: DUF1294 domain-containing protein [Bacilli bacterium]|nr:DUF1294 domain-containing protein [Bacilli bacterium]